MSKMGIFSFKKMFYNKNHQVIFMNPYDHLLKELKKYPNIIRKQIWNIYHNELSYIKVLNSDTNLDEYGYIYQMIINSLKNIGKINGLPKILNIWQTDLSLIAYQMEKMSGFSIHEILLNDKEPLKTFYKFLKSLLPIIKECETKNMVSKT